MDWLLRIQILLLLAICHGPLIVYLFRRTLQQKTLIVADFGVMGVIFYFDFGLITQLTGLIPYDHYRLEAFYANFDEIKLLSLVIILVAPYCYLFFAKISGPPEDQALPASKTQMIQERSWLFYFIVYVIVVPAGIWGLLFYLEDPVGVRERFRALGLGFWYNTLFTPTFMLAFYVRQKDSETPLGQVTAFVLMLAAVTLTLPIASRTNVLLPILVYFVFKPTRFGLNRLIIIASVLAIVAGALVPLYYLQGRFSREFEAEQAIQREVAQRLIYNDFSRAELLSESLDHALPVGTQIMPHPMKGYVYTALLYIPRSLAPGKGHPTAQYYTAYMFNWSMDDDRLWGFGLGVIPEAVINGGVLFLIVMLPLFGLLLGYAQYLSQRIPSLIVPLSLGAFWAGGYISSVLLNLFGLMFIVIILLEWFFVTPGKQAQKRAAASLPPVKPNVAPLEGVQPLSGSPNP